jgi:hypothetical protein
MTREAADGLYAALGSSVDAKLEQIASSATVLRKSMEAGFYSRRAVDIGRWATRQLQLCSETFCCPPPPELVALVAHMLGADKAERGIKKNRAKFIAAAHYVAKYPDATPGRIATAIRYDQKTVIAGWLEDQEFQEIVGSRRLRLAHQKNAKG